VRRLVALLIAVPLLAPATARAKGDDPYAPAQWGLRAIGAQAAWTVSTGVGVVVAVIDTGVDGGHPDLQGRILPGRDFVEDDGDPSDDNGHGTLIAGIVAANTSNGVGVASVAPGARVLPVRVLDREGSGTSDDVVEGIRWAVDNGAQVINLSLAQESGGGSAGLIVPPSLLRDPSVDAAIREAAGAGATVVVAAGNSSDGGDPETAYDATVPGVLVVGASTSTGTRAAYSNYGAGLDLLAPGGGRDDDATDRACDQRTSIISTWWNPFDQRSDYGGGCGTSMAVGFVSGVAALSAALGMSNVEATERILGTARDAGAPGADDKTGAGILDAARAVGARAAGPAAAPAGSPPAITPGRVGQSVLAQAPRATVPAPTPRRGPVALAEPDPAPEPGVRPRTATTAAAILLLAVLLLGHAQRLITTRSRARSGRAS
jgi:subtilisin family serine protease